MRRRGVSCFVGGVASRWHLMEELVAWEYFGFHPNRLYHEIYAVGYNEFLCAVSALRDALLEEFPERQSEIQNGCDKLLASYSRNLDEKWFQKFIQFCSSNVFTVPPQVTVYSGLQRLGERETGSSAAADELHHRLMATQYVIGKLRERIELLDKELVKRREMLQRVKREEMRLGMVLEAQGLERQLRDKEGQLLEVQSES